MATREGPPPRDAFILRLTALTASGVACGVTLLVLAEASILAFGHPRVVTVLEKVIGPICHHLPERTFRMAWGDTPFPVCSRCTGLYSGWVFGVVLGLMIAPRAGRALKGVMISAVIAALAALIEASAERLHLARLD